jgi:hypothetical protein
MAVFRVTVERISTGERAQVVTAGDWTGPTHGMCRKCGSVAARFPSVTRVTHLTFEHHQIVAALSDAEAIRRSPTPDDFRVVEVTRDR